MTGYEYGNTRLRAMRSRLLTSTDFSEMILAGSLDRMLAMLADTPYGPDVEGALVRARGLSRLDETIRSHLARTLRRMASFYGDEARERVDLLLHRWDLRNLRALLRLPEAPMVSGDVSRLLVPAGRLDEADLAELAAQPDVGSLIDLMVAWGIPSAETAIALIRARVRYRAEGDPTVLESALDRVFAEEMDQVLGGEDTGPASILRAEIDARNFETALRLRAARVDGEPGWTEIGEAYVPGGLLRVDIWSEVAQTDSAEASAEMVMRRPLLSGWESAIRAWVSHGELTRLAEELQRATTSAAISRFVTGDVLDFDVPLAFTFAKEAEARNLHLIGRGIVHGIPGTELEARLEVAA